MVTLLPICCETIRYTKYTLPYIVSIEYHVDYTTKKPIFLPQMTYGEKLFHFACATRFRGVPILVFTILALRFWSTR